MTPEEEEVEAAMGPSMDRWIAIFTDKDLMLSVPKLSADEKLSLLATVVGLIETSYSKLQGTMLQAMVEESAMLGTAVENAVTIAYVLGRAEERRLKIGL